MTKREQIWHWLMARPAGAYSQELQAHFGFTLARSIRVLREMRQQGCVTRKPGEPTARNSARFVYFANAECPPIGPGKYDRSKLRRSAVLRVTVRDAKQIVTTRKAIRHGNKSLIAVRLATMPVVRLG